jgi:Ca2+-binding EF-hand superfamily protein
MGHKTSKPCASLRYNFQRYGLSADEGEALEKYFNHIAGRNHKMDQKDFQKVYTNLNPEIQHSKSYEITKKAFQVFDVNHDGCITFDEFLGFYILHKSLPHNVLENMTSFLNRVNEDRGYITYDQAKSYTKFANNYSQLSNENFSPAGTIQIFEECFDNYEQIPIHEFVDKSPIRNKRMLI